MVKPLNEPAPEKTAQTCHDRYVEQAIWSSPLRQYLLKKTGLQKDARVLEVGCGTGAVLQSLFKETDMYCMGVDISLSDLRYCHQTLPGIPIAAGDAYTLPFRDDCLDAVVCHFLLLWLSEPVRALKQMVRVTRPEGWVMAFAEPDYGGRIDHPETLVGPGNLQAHALERQGANPTSGRFLPDWFEQIGLVDISCGVMGAEWKLGQIRTDLETESTTLEQDLKGFVSVDTLDRWQKEDKEAQERGVRVLYVPTFWAIGKKPG